MEHCRGKKLGTFFSLARNGAMMSLSGRSGDIFISSPANIYTQGGAGCESRDPVRNPHYLDRSSQVADFSQGSRSFTF
jgi:hypothetical protein